MGFLRHWPAAYSREHDERNHRRLARNAGQRHVRQLPRLSRQQVGLPAEHLDHACSSGRRCSDRHGRRAVSRMRYMCRCPTTPSRYSGPDPARQPDGDGWPAVGGTSELQVGEGKQDAPVGTTLAMIEQATKILNAQSISGYTRPQAQEFKLLVECFQRAFRQSLGSVAARRRCQWSEAMFLKALDDCDLVPQADPNTASHTQRVMKIPYALKQLQAASPAYIRSYRHRHLRRSRPSGLLKSAAIPGCRRALRPSRLRNCRRYRLESRRPQQMADAKTTEANAKMAERERQGRRGAGQGGEGGCAWT